MKILRELHAGQRFNLRKLRLIVRIMFQVLPDHVPCACVPGGIHVHVQDPFCVGRHLFGIKGSRLHERRGEEAGQEARDQCFRYPTHLNLQ